MIKPRYILIVHIILKLFPSINQLVFELIQLCFDGIPEDVWPGQSLQLFAMGA